MVRRAGTIGKAIDTEINNTATLTRRSRFLWLLALFTTQFLYFPINRLVAGGVILTFPWDSLVPFWPVWAVPYLLSLSCWAGCFVWAAFKMEDRRYQAFVIASIFTMATSYILYIVYPTYVERPAIQGSGWQFELVRWIYSNDRLNNAFPSGHTYNTVLILLFWWDWRPKLRLPWSIFSLVIVLSTLFTGQHNLPDALGGILWAVSGSLFGWWCVSRFSRR